MRAHLQAYCPDTSAVKVYCLYLCFIQAELMTSESNYIKETISCTPVSVIFVLSNGTVQYHVMISDYQK